MNQHQFGESDDSEEILVSAENGMSYRQVQDKQRQFNIHQIITKRPGTWVKVLDREAIKVWDGVVWLEFPFALVVELGLLPHNLSETLVDSLIGIALDNRDCVIHDVIAPRVKWRGQLSAPARV